MYSETTNESLTFVLEGKEQVVALRAKVRVNREDIVSVGWYEKFQDWPNFIIRMPGSFLPNWMMAGSYWNDEGWDFVFAKKPKGTIKPVLFNVLVVETNKSRYKRVIIQMEKPESNEILNWWKEK